MKQKDGSKSCENFQITEYMTTSHFHVYGKIHSVELFSFAIITLFLQFNTNTLSYIAVQFKSKSL